MERAEITPTFNPTSLAEHEVYATMTKSMVTAPDWLPLHIQGTKRSIHRRVDAWFVVEKSEIINGYGFVSNRQRWYGELGDVNYFLQHRGYWALQGNRQLLDRDTASPFLKVYLNPLPLSLHGILENGDGVCDSEDGLVVHANVASNRIVARPDPFGAGVDKAAFLVGGLAEAEFVACYEPLEFARQHTPEDAAMFAANVGRCTRDEAIAGWQEVASSRLPLEY